jgi:hypothetical protein
VLELEEDHHMEDQVEDLHTGEDTDTQYSIHEQGNNHQFVHPKPEHKEERTEPDNPLLENKLRLPELC